jgi:hypothetical protein
MQNTIAKSELIEACEIFAERLALADSRERVRASAARLIRKGRTLYIVSPEAREMRRIDAIASEARYA